MPIVSPVVLIFSCEADRRNGRDQAIFETWVSAWNHLVPMKFVYGDRPPTSRHFDVYVEAPDDYGGLSKKQIAAYKWALTKDYTHVFVCFTDTYVLVPRLLASNFTRGSYIGRPHEGYAGGGCGYWLDREALQVCANGPAHTHVFSDQNDGRNLFDAGIKLTRDDRYCRSIEDGGISLHLSKGTGVYDPMEMKRAHRTALDRP